MLTMHANQLHMKPAPRKNPHWEVHMTAKTRRSEIGYLGMHYADKPPNYVLGCSGWAAEQAAHGLSIRVIGIQGSCVSDRVHGESTVCSVGQKEIRKRRVQCMKSEWRDAESWLVWSAGGKEQGVRSAEDMIVVEGYWMIELQRWDRIRVVFAGSTRSCKYLPQSACCKSTWHWK